MKLQYYHPCIQEIVIQPQLSGSYFSAIYFQRQTAFEIILMSLALGTEISQHSYPCCPEVTLICLSCSFTVNFCSIDI